MAKILQFSFFFAPLIFCCSSLLHTVICGTIYKWKIICKYVYMWSIFITNTGQKREKNHHCRCRLLHGCVFRHFSNFCYFLVLLRLVSRTAHARKMQSGKSSNNNNEQKWKTEQKKCYYYTHIFYNLPIFFHR